MPCQRTESSASLHACHTVMTGRSSYTQCPAGPGLVPVDIAEAEKVAVIDSVQLLHCYG